MNFISTSRLVTPLLFVGPPRWDGLASQTTLFVVQTIGKGHVISLCKLVIPKSDCSSCHLIFNIIIIMILQNYYTIQTIYI